MKGQELPITTVILIILALLIVVLVIIYVIIPISRTPTNSTPATNMTSFAFNCGTYCQPASNNNLPSNTPYCTSTINYGGQTYHCYTAYDSKVIAQCSSEYEANNGTFWLLDQVTCQQH